MTAAAAPRALLLVRNPFEHDARVLRAARTLRDAGHRPLVVAAVTSEGQPRRSDVDGIPVVRVAPSRALAWALRRFAPAPAPSAAPETGAAHPRPMARRLGVRAFRGVRTLDFNRGALAVVLRERPRLLHCNDYNTMWVGVAAKLLLSCRVVYDSHELWPDRNGRWEWRPWLLAAEALFTRAADRVVAASPAYAERMARRYRIPPPAVVRNVPDAAAASTAARVGQGEAPGLPVVAYVGHLTTGRGLEVAVEVLALVPEVRMRFIGPARPELVERLQRRARELGIEQRLEIRGPVPPDEVVPALAGAVAGLNLWQPICLSYELTWPNKLVEYIAAGVPVLSSDVPVCARVVREYGVGEVVPAGDVEAIAAGLRRLLEPARRDELREGLRRAAADLSWENERRGLADAYAAALA